MHIPPPPFPLQPPRAPGLPPAHLNQAARPPVSTPSGYPTYSNIPATTIANQNQQLANAIYPAQTATNPAPSKEQTDQAWKEYTAPSGIKYYHNSILNESTYTKPEALMKKEIPKTSNTSQRKWKEYEDATSGKKYYSDGTTTTWEKPPGFQSEADNSVPTEESEPPKKKKKSASNTETSFANKDEAIAAFKGLLLAKGIPPALKWNEAVKMCSADSRWDACEDVLTVGERRQALAEYQTKRANELRNLERQERIRAKDAFGQLLTDVLPSVSSFSAWGSRFADVRGALSKDDRFYAVEDEGTRESLFLDFCEEFRKRDERKKRSKKREAQDAFLSFLSEKEETGALTFASTWYVVFFLPYFGFSNYLRVLMIFLLSLGILSYLR